MNKLKVIPISVKDSDAQLNPTNRNKTSLNWLYITSVNSQIDYKNWMKRRGVWIFYLWGVHGWSRLAIIQDNKVVLTDLNVPEFLGFAFSEGRLSSTHWGVVLPIHKASPVSLCLKSGLFGLTCALKYVTN